MAKKGKSQEQVLPIPKPIRWTVGILGALSAKWQTAFASRLFATPIRHQPPKRELHMIQNSRITECDVPSVSRKITVYEYGKSEKKILLVHGWSGRGTQLVKIADALLAQGYQTISFDAPAHGKSPGSQTLMTDFIAAIHELDKTFGPFEAVVAHSLGGMATLNAIAEGVSFRSAVIIGSGNKISEILEVFARSVGQGAQLVQRIREHFEKRFLGRTMESYSSYMAASRVRIPLLIIHDKQDQEVPVHCALEIHEAAPGSQLLVTDGLGHRKILGDESVISATSAFIQKYDT